MTTRVALEAYAGLAVQDLAGHVNVVSKLRKKERKRERKKERKKESKLNQTKKETTNRANTAPKLNQN